MTDLMGRSTAPRLEPWQDARRIPERYSTDAPATFEWWYVDAQLSGGQALVVAFVVEPDTAEARFAYRTQVFLMRPDGPPLKLTHRTFDDMAILSDRPDIRIGQSSLRADRGTYRLVIDPANHSGFGLDVTITGSVPARVPPAGTDVILGGADGFGWVNPVPRGNLAGTMTENGQTVEIRGVAYHDHNWGSATLGSAFHQWIWGRATAGPFTAVFLNIVPTPAYRTGPSDVQSLYIASADEVLLNVSGAGVAKVTAPTAPNPDTRNREAYFAQQVLFELEHQGRRFTLEITPARFIHDIDLVEDTTYLDADERARAARMTIKPWYTEFVAAPVRLTMDQGQGAGEPVVREGTGIVEFMDFHLDPQ
jgi:hypothetical protein